MSTERTPIWLDHRGAMRALPWLWLALSATWAVLIFATEQPALPLALWIAITLGPITILQARLKAQQSATEPSR